MTTSEEKSWFVLACILLSRKLSLFSVTSANQCSEVKPTQVACEKVQGRIASPFVALNQDLLVEIYIDL